MLTWLKLAGFRVSRLRSFTQFSTNIRVVQHPLGRIAMTSRARHRAPRSKVLGVGSFQRSCDQRATTRPERAVPLQNNQEELLEAPTLADYGAAAFLAPQAVYRHAPGVACGSYMARTVLGVCSVSYEWTPSSASRGEGWSHAQRLMRMFPPSSAAGPFWR